MKTQHIVLVGLPGVGKSTMGKALATATNRPLVDTDLRIKAQTGKTINEIFAQQGEETFRNLETHAISKALESPTASVIPLGGGAVLRERNRQMLQGHRVIYLQASPKTVAARIANNVSARPLFKGADPVVKLQELLNAREYLYKQVATDVLNTDGMTFKQSTDALERLVFADPVARNKISQIMQAATISRQREALRRVDVGGPRPYQVLIGQGASAQLSHTLIELGYSKSAQIAIIHPRLLSTAAYALATQLVQRGWNADALAVPDGESAKNVETLAGLWHGLGQMGMGRDGVIIGLGGGATTDLAGFAAATWLRGVGLVQMPTTVLATVDAAVGGKTGIDTVHGKNLVGAFYPPQAVLADIAYFDSLPASVARQGLAEVIKCGFIKDLRILELVADNDAQQLLKGEVLTQLIERSVKVKADVVSQDLYEGGLREILNYGHTYAHALEKLSDFSLSHGQAVSIGCVFAAEVARRRGMLSDAEVALHRLLLSKAGLPISRPDNLEVLGWHKLREVMSSDKKVRGGNLRMVLLNGLGNPVVVDDLDQSHLRAAHEALAPGRK